jgi:hypothetical protein
VCPHAQPGWPIRGASPAAARHSSTHAPTMHTHTCRESAVLAPTDDGAHSRCFISESFDETSHFETTMSDVQHVYRRLTGQVIGAVAPNLAVHQQAARASGSSMLRTDCRVCGCTQHTGAGLVRGCGVAASTLSLRGVSSTSLQWIYDVMHMHITPLATRAPQSRRPPPPAWHPPPPSLPASAVETESARAVPLAAAAMHPGGSPPPQQLHGTTRIPHKYWCVLRVLRAWAWVENLQVAPGFVELLHIELLSGALVQRDQHHLHTALAPHSHHTGPLTCTTRTKQRAGRRPG